MTQIVLPSYAVRSPLVAQAFRAAVLHGICYRKNLDVDARRTSNHGYSVGWWIGMVHGRSLTMSHDYRALLEKSFYKDVLAEVNRIDDEFSAPSQAAAV